MTRVLRAAFFAAIGIACILAVYRLVLVGLGPDPDSDAYGHHAIAREILVAPRNLSVHWVWLPLFHYLSAIFVLFGAGIDTIRVMNVVVTAVAPILFFRMLVRANASAVVALMASVLFAANPIVMQMGTTAQTEPLFCLLMLVCAAKLAEQKHLLAGVALGAAVMVRYEAWAAYLAVSGIVALGVVTKRMTLRAWPVVAIPAATILAWAVARWIHGEALFGFLRETRQFANDALRSHSAFDGGPRQVFTDVQLYTIGIPGLLLGPVLYLVPFGIVRTIRQTPWLALTHGAMLAFITFTWLTRSQLGLFRHMTAIVPLYALSIAHGIEAIADFSKRLVLRLADEEAARFAARTCTASLVLFTAIAGGTVLDRWMKDWTNAIRGAWPDRLAAGSFLRGIQGSPIIVCDESTVEILSRVDRRRFDRSWVDAPSTVAHVRALTLTDDVYVATWASKTKDIRPLGDVVFHDHEDLSQGLIVIHIAR